MGTYIFEILQLSSRECVKTLILTLKTDQNLFVEVFMRAHAYQIGGQAMMG